MAQPRMLEQKVVVVTGAGRGIGRAISLAAAREGARVVVNDFGGAADGSGGDRAPADEVVAEIAKEDGKAVASFESVSDHKAAGRIIEQALDTFGAIDCVVSNAGILRDCIFHKMTVEDFDAVIDVHLRGSFNVASAAAPHYRKQKHGSFVFMTSTSGLIGNFGQANYAAAKMGIVGLSKSIALDMSRFNVTSNCISPFAWSRLIGTIPTDTDAQKERVAKLKAMTPAKIAPLAVYLASDEADDVTGQIFAIRNNEIFLMGQSRPVRTAHTGDGWTPQTVASRVIPSLRPSFFPLERSADVFSWDPV